MLKRYRSEGGSERDMESLGVMGWGLAAVDNSSTVAVAARGGPLDYRHVICFFEKSQDSMILLVFIGQQNKEKKIKNEMGRSGCRGSICLVVAL